MHFTWWNWNVSHIELACMVMSQNSLRIQHGCPCCSHCRVWRRVCNTAFFTIRLCSKFWQQVATSEISGCQINKCRWSLAASAKTPKNIYQLGSLMMSYVAWKIMKVQKSWHGFCSGKNLKNGPFYKTRRWWNPSVHHGPSAQEFSKLVKSPKLKFWMSPLDHGLVASWTSWTSSILYGKKNLVGPYFICRDCRVYMDIHGI